MEIIKNLSLFTIKTIIILLLSMLFVSNLQVQQTDKNGRITQTYNIINCYSVLQAGFYQMGEQTCYNDLWKSYQVQHLNQIEVERCMQDMANNPNLICD